jgi:ribosomal protein L35
MGNRSVNKTIKKRFKLTKNGKLMRKHKDAGHRMSHKNKRQIRRFAEPLELSKALSKMVKRYI